MKGQRSLELMGAFGLVGVVMIATVSYSLGSIPAISQEADRTEKYVETHFATEKLFSENEYLELSSNSLESGLSQEIGQYTNFDHSVKIEEFKVLNLESSFIRGSSPGSIQTEPNYRDDAENEVIYGSDVVGEDSYQFIVTAKDGEYDRLYRNTGSGTWSASSLGDTIIQDWTVLSFQNRPPREGHSVVLSRSLVEEFDESGDNSIKINRFGYINDRIIRVEVLTW